MVQAQKTKLEMAFCRTSSRKIQFYLYCPISQITISHRNCSRSIIFPLRSVWCTLNLGLSSQNSPSFQWKLVVVQQLHIFRWEKDFSAVFCFCRTAAAHRLWFFCGIYFHVCSRFPRCCRSRIVRESIKVYFRGIACSLNRDLNFKRLLFKWRTRRDPSLWKGVTL